MVSAGKRSKGIRPGRVEKEKKDRTARGIGSTLRGKIGRGSGGREGKGMVVARMQFFQFAANNVPSIKSALFCTAPCRFVSIIYTVRRDYAPRERMVDLLDLFRSDYVDRKRKRKREEEKERETSGFSSLLINNRY